MDTQDTGASTEEALSGDSSTQTTDESATGETSEAGTQEDAATLLQRISDKDAHIVKLEKELLTLKPKKETPKKREAVEDPDDVMTWMTMNTDSLKLVGKEFQEELKFYKDHGIPVTNEIRDRALRDARSRKGVGPKVNAEEQRQAQTSAPVQGEMRKTAQITEVPESVKKYYPDMTLERYLKYKPEIDARKKR